MRNTFGAEQVRDPLLLISRILMMILFVVFGWQKLTGYSGTIAYFAQGGVPFPSLAAPIAVINSGLFLLYLTGAGRFSLDEKLKLG